MSLREGMHSLVGQIGSARETRGTSLSSIRQGVVRQRESGRQFVHQLHQAHQRMAREMRTGLDQGETQRRSGVQRTMGEITGDRTAARAEWRSMAGARHGEQNGGSAPSTASDKGPGSPAQTSGKAAVSGHRARASRR